MAAFRTPLYDWHVSHGARMIEFGGWEMPLQFTGIVEEHLAVRSAAGLFDVSHMGKLLLTGSGAHEAIARLSTNDTPATPGRARYTHLLDDEGRIIDDVIFTCLGPDRFLCVCNAGPRRRLVPWIKDHLRGQELRDLTSDFLCLALQGPEAPGILSRLTSTDVESLKTFRALHVRLKLGREAMAVFRPAEMEGWGGLGGLAEGPASAAAGSAESLTPSILVTRTGYTGEQGFELFPPAALAVPVWSALLDAGADVGVRPVGLGARDTLRLEKGYLLSGQDFTGRETSLETNSEWLVKWDHEFIGREALQVQKERGDHRRLLGLRLADRGVPRHGCRVLAGERDVGVVTSGTQTPFLRKSIGLAYVPVGYAAAGTGVDIDIRGRRARARIVPLPFYRRAKPSRPVALSRQP